jgi:hypothetical protein
MTIFSLKKIRYTICFQKFHTSAYQKIDLIGVILLFIYKIILKVWKIYFKKSKNIYQFF